MGPYGVVRQKAKMSISIHSGICDQEYPLIIFFVLKTSRLGAMLEKTHQIYLRFFPPVALLLEIFYLGSS